MTVKADSKGRLTGAQPETRYTRKEHPDGRIEYVPEVPNKFDEIRSITNKQFTEFFGDEPGKVLKDGIELVEFSAGEDYLPTGIMLTRFITTETGARVYQGGQSLKERVFIRIERE